MAIGTDYATPVNVNGYACKNCTDVDRAKRFIDPANPAGGPFGINDASGKSTKGHVAVFRPDAMTTANQGTASPSSYRRNGQPGAAMAGSHVDLTA